MGDYVNGVMHREIHRGVGINVWIVWISWENCWRKGGWLTGREWESFKRRNCRIQNGKMTGSGLYV